MNDTRKNITRLKRRLWTQNKIARKIGQILHEESHSIQPRILLIRIITSLIPQYSGMRVRTHILRVAGIKIGHGSVIMGTPILYGAGKIVSRLQIGSDAVINIGCTFDLNAPISIGDHVAIGHNVLFLTSSHRMDNSVHRAGSVFTKPITVKNGAWIGARSIIMPGVTVGAGSVVGAGAVVTKDVPPDTLVGGVPARAIYEMSGD